MFSAPLKHLVNLIYPMRCAGCRRDMDATDRLGVCSFCVSQIRPNPKPFCRSCGRGVGMPQARCDECSVFRPAFDRAWSACLYEGVMRELIHGFKYSGKRAMAGFLSGLMKDFVADNPEVLAGIETVTFVPLDKARLLRRGFNQSELLAESFAAGYSFPVMSLLGKRKRTRNQNELSRDKRLKNLDGAFSVRTGTQRLAGCSILLIDDVMTTGATLSECAKVLKAAGAKEVRCLTPARGL